MRTSDHIDMIEMLWKALEVDQLFADVPPTFNEAWTDPSFVVDQVFLDSVRVALENMRHV